LFGNCWLRVMSNLLVEHLASRTSCAWDVHINLDWRVGGYQGSSYYLLLVLRLQININRCT
jgi:hypothetical protein